MTTTAEKETVVTRADWVPGPAVIISSPVLIGSLAGRR